MDNNYPDILFDDSLPLSIDNLNEGNQEPILLTSIPFTFSPMEVLVLDPHLAFSSYVDSLLEIQDSIYMDMHD